MITTARSGAGLSKPAGHCTGTTYESKTLGLGTGHSQKGKAREPQCRVIRDQGSCVGEANDIVKHRIDSLVLF